MLTLHDTAKIKSNRQPFIAPRATF